MSQDEEQKIEPTEFDRLIANLGRLKQFPIEPQPINPTQIRADFLELILKVGDRAMQRVAENATKSEESSGSLTGNDWDDSTARSLVRRGLAKDLNEAIQMVKEAL